MDVNATSRVGAIRQSIDALVEVVSTYDRLGLMVPAVHAATALAAARVALEEYEIVPYPIEDVEWDT